MAEPKEMRERLLDGDTDPVFCKQVLAHIDDLQRKYNAACASSDSYKSALHSTTS